VGDVGKCCEPQSLVFGFSIFKPTICEGSKGCQGLMSEIFCSNPVNAFA
jgi:hypothetical protein